MIAALGRLSELRPFYLGGGTALALRFGHRLSYDLDLFANIETLGDDLRRQIVTSVGQDHEVNLIQDSPLGLVFEADGQPISFFSYGYARLEPTDSIDELQIAGVLDIGLMKLDAVAGRGARKDFYDLYFIARQVSLEAMFTRSADKYPHSHGFGMRVITSLIDFDSAEQQDEPTMLTQAAWGDVKSFFLAEARQLGLKWAGLSQAED
ncbi:MAG: nucleotidyl transferase AbiEii/AbiGii toxin family protein [Chloroflexota bacterium]